MAAKEIIRLEGAVVNCAYGLKFGEKTDIQGCAGCCIRDRAGKGSARPGVAVIGDERTPGRVQRAGSVGVGKAGRGDLG